MNKPGHVTTGNVLDDLDLSPETKTVAEERARITVIKRYKNRKLYDTVASKYVTLEDVRKLVKEGHDVMVVDNTTKQNITAMTLLQAFYEVQKKKIENGDIDAPRMSDLMAALRAM